MEPAPLGTGHVPVPDPGGCGRGRRDRARAAHTGDLLSSDLQLAERMARDAGALLLERFGGPAREVDVKSSSTDMVSAADRDAEDLIHAALREERPDDGLLAEEGGRAASGSGRRWIVDPLDGTTNFLYGFPAWAVSIGLEDAEGGLAGIVFDPVRGELFAAERGAGATLNGEPISVRRARALDRALIATGFGYDAERRALQVAVLERVLPRVRDIRRAGAAALDLSWLAAGRLDGYYERGLNPWDWSAGRLIVTEAGGQVADLDGDPHGLAAAGPELLPGLLSLLGSAETGVFAT